MIKPIFDELSATRPRRHFTVGIYDDVTHLSLPIDTDFRQPRPAGEVQAMFFGLGSDGTVGANKASVKIIGEGTDLFTQGYFVYDSKKSGSITVSHLRFGPEPIRSTYLVEDADFVACHQFGLLGKTKVLEFAKHGATFLLNSPYGPDEVWEHLPGAVQRLLIDKAIDFWMIDAFAVADEAGMGSRINTVMQPCFFQLAGILPADDAIARIKAWVQKTYAKRGEATVARNFDAIDRSLARLTHVDLGMVSNERATTTPLPDGVPDFVARVTARLMAGDGDQLPVSALPVDGAFPTGTTRVREAGDRPDDPDLGSIDLHRLRQVRDGLPARHDPDEGVPDGRPRRGAGRLRRQGVPVARPARSPTHDPGRARRLHRLRRLRRRLPGKEQDRLQPQGDQHGSGGRAPRRGARSVGLLPVDRATRSEPDPARFGQGQPGPRTPVRVLRRVRRMRRDPLHPLGQPAVRRPDDRGQRDGLLVDLRRQPADHTMDRQRRGSWPRVEQFAVRGQRGIRARDAPRPRRAERPGPPPGRAPRPGDRRGTRAERSSTGRRTPRPRSSSSGIGSASCATRWSGSTDRLRPTLDTCSRSRTTSFARASGSSAATAGPTTSGSVAWTRSCRRVATSTSSSSTPRSIRTPAASPPRRRRAVRWPSSRPPARGRPRRTSVRSHVRTATSTSPRCRWVRTISRRRRRCSKPMPGRARRSSSRTAHASPTGSTCRSR